MAGARRRRRRRYIRDSTREYASAAARIQSRQPHGAPAIPSVAGEDEMSAVAFVNSLLDTGRVRVGPSPVVPDDLADAVRELDRAARPNLAFVAPELLSDVAEWALLVLYRGCQALVYREIEADAVRVALAVPCPQPPSPAACYSADLA